MRKVIIILVLIVLIFWKGELRWSTLYNLIASPAEDADSPSVYIPPPTPASVAEPTIAAPLTSDILQAPARSIDVIFLRGDYLYFNADATLVILDMSDRQSPRLLGSVTLPVETIFNLYVAGNYAYIAAAEDGLRIVDISNPARPIEVGVYQPPLLGEVAGFPASAGLPPIDLFQRQGARGVGVGQADGQLYAYIAALGAGLRVVDVSDPAQPVEVGVLTTDEGGFVDVAIVNDRAYLAQPGVGVQIVDISQPTMPQAAGSVALTWPKEVWSLTASSDQTHSPYIYGAAGTCVGQEPGNCPGALHIIDAAHPADPTSYSSPLFYGYSTALAVNGRYAYLLGMSGLHVLDVSDPTLPLHLTLLINRNGRDMVIADDMLYLAGQDAVQIFDLANPVVPMLVSQWEINQLQ